MTGRTIGTRLQLAQARSDEARARLSQTFGTLKSRTTPQAIAQDVAETLKARGLDALNGIVDTARREPVYVGVVLALVIAFLARHKIARAISRDPTPPPHPDTLKRGSSK